MQFHVHALVVLATFFFSIVLFSFVNRKPPSRWSPCKTEEEGKEEEEAVVVVAEEEETKNKEEDEVL